MQEPDFLASRLTKQSFNWIQWGQRRPRHPRKSASMVLSLMTAMGLAGVGWLGQEMMVPHLAQAYTTRVDVSVDNLPGETYETLLRRAEAVARAAAQRSFDRDILTTEVSVVVTAQNDGATTPLLALEVSRTQWRSFPDPRRWATYYRSARFLLGFERAIPLGTGPANISSPSIQVNPVPSATPNNLPPSTPAPAGNAPTSNPGVAPAGTTPNTTPGVAPAGTTPNTTPGVAPAGTTPNTTPGTIPSTIPGNAPAPPTTPGSPGSSPAPGT